MRTLGGFCIALLCAGGLYAQHHSGGNHSQSQAFRGTQSFGHQSFGYQSYHRSAGGRAYGYPAFGFPVYVGTYYSPFGYDLPDYSDYSSYYGYGDQSAAAQQQPSNVTVVYPPQPATASPVIINMGAPGQNGSPAPSGPPAPPESYYRGPGPQQQDDTTAVEPTHYLIALKDHTIYSAVAYWVDGSTLHYFTTGNTHNQISVSLVDRELTERLNKGSGLQVELPPAK